MFWRLFEIFNLDLFVPAIKVFFSTSPIWLPIVLFMAFMNVWLRYVRTQFIIKQGSVLLEIKLPKEVRKTPLAMEIILTSLYQSGASDYLKTFLQGKIRPWFSLEIVSIEGQVRFFIWTPPKFRQLIESQFYSQYPGVEIYEAEDYTKDVFVDPANLPLWGTTFKLTKDDIYPIKTYVDYGMDNSGVKEEEKIDPMTSTLEFLGSLKKGEQVWIQILIQAHRKTTMKDDAAWNKPDWKDAGKKEVEELIAKLVRKSGDNEVPRQPTEGEKQVINALERSLSKFPFEVGIRGFYIAKKESFDSIGITGLIGSLRQYNSNVLNGFKLGKFTDFDYPWEDFRRIRRTGREKKLLNAYKLRSFFYIPYKFAMAKPFILTTEELATIFHIPGQVAVTPTLSKTPSRKSEAPANLPI